LTSSPGGILPARANKAFEASLPRIGILAAYRLLTVAAGRALPLTKPRWGRIVTFQSIDAEEPALSLTVTLNGYRPAVVPTPVRTPDTASRVSPGGNEPVDVNV
jgi:hypothetical protein